MKSHTILWHYHVIKDNDVVIRQIQTVRVFLEVVAVDHNELAPVFDLWRLAIRFSSVAAIALALLLNFYHGVNLFQKEISCFLDFNNEWPFLVTIFLEVCHFINLSILSVVKEFLNLVSFVEDLALEGIKYYIKLALDLFNVGQFVKFHDLGSRLLFLLNGVHGLISKYYL